MRQDKRDRAMEYYNGHKGIATIAHVERNLLSAYPEAQAELTGVQYGKVMSVANTSYQDGKTSNQADMWAYDAPDSWLMGIRGTDIYVEMEGDTIKVKTRTADKETVQTYKRQ